MAQVAVVERLRGTARLKTIIVAGLVSLLIALLGTPLLTSLMRRHGFGQPIRVEGPKSHETKRGTLADLLDDCERHLPALEKQIARIERLLRDALDLARSDDGGLALVLTRVNLASLVCGVAQSLEAELARAIVVDAPAALWVECDAARIEQVLGDLLRYVARGDGQERDVYMRVTEVAEGAKGGMRSARIAIWYLRAAAPNMPDCPVATTHFGTNSAASPLDLRLALSAAILRQHGGSLRLVYGSDEADGSEMVLTLPVHEAHPTPSMQTGQTGELHGTPHPRRGR